MSSSKKWGSSIANEKQQVLLEVEGVSMLLVVVVLTNLVSFVSYSISNFTPKVGEKDTQRAIRQAFNVWQAVTPLSFQVRQKYKAQMM